MKSTRPLRVKTITDYHKLRGLPKPVHPLISLINFGDMCMSPDNVSKRLVLDFYAIALKRNFNGKVKYGQEEYNLEAGLMTFISPKQVFAIESAGKLSHSGWLLLIHPDFLWNAPLTRTIGQYAYFGYSVNEALHLSEEEETTVLGILHHIGRECHANADQFSQGVIMAQIELLLTYAERFYHRQFISRKPTNHKLIDRLEGILNDYFSNDTLARKGLPTVQYVADSLNVSANYLSVLLKVLTGQSTQQHIHNKLIEKAKERLSITDLSVSEIAYELGFEHSQSFSKLFKNKAGLSPLEFRLSFHSPDLLVKKRLQQSEISLQN